MTAPTPRPHVDAPVAVRLQCPECGAPVDSMAVAPPHWIIDLEPCGHEVTAEALGIAEEPTR